MKLIESLEINKVKFYFENIEIKHNLPVKHRTIS